MPYSGSGPKQDQDANRCLVAILVLITAATLTSYTYHFVHAKQAGQPVLVLTPDKQEYLLGTYLEYLEDPKGELTLEKVRSPEYDPKFKAGSQDILNFGLTDSVYWLRIRIRNKAPVTTKWRLELGRPSLNTIVLYIPEETGAGYIERKTGYVYPFATRDVPHESFVFNLPITTGTEQVIYLSVKDKALGLPFRIWQTEALEQRDQTSRLLIGLSFGALIIMFIYNLFLTIALWDKGFLYYSFFQISLLFFLGSVQAYAPRYLWPEQTQINTFAIPLFAELGLIGAMLFAGTFLQIDQQPTGWKISYRILLATMIFFVLPTLFIGAKALDVVLPLGLVILIYIPLMAVRAWLYKFKPARFYLLSWIVFFIVGFGIILERMGIFTIRQLIPEQALQFSCVYIVAFQSIALADRFNLYKQETINAQSAFMEQQHEALNLKDALTQTLKNTRDELEHKVLERTQALTNVNEKLAIEVEERKRTQKEAELLARTDPLTGLFNRRHFSYLAELEFERAIRYKHPLSIIIFDIDHFKNVNDTFGHQVGDKALVHITQVFQQQARNSDVLARYGGEEFITLLPETTSTEAEYTAERLRQVIQQAGMLINGQTLTLTVSIGVASINTPDAIINFEELLKEADEALYQAKNFGRNRVIAFDKRKTSTRNPAGITRKTKK
jgi:diguanylate cyclase (GGDEF)-like protein